MNFVVHFLCLLSLLLLSNAGSRAQQLSSTQHPVTNASLTTDVPWSIMLVGGGGQCSGLVLTPRWILTAAHCTHGTQITVFWANSAGTAQRIYFGTATPHPHPDYDTSHAGPLWFKGDDPSDDIMLYELASAVSPFPGPAQIFADRRRPWELKHWSKNASNFVVAGWGGSTAPGGGTTCPPSGQSAGGKRLGVLHLLNPFIVNGWMEQRYKFKYASGKSSSQRLCGGDSGAPWVLRRGTMYLAFAVHSGGKAIEDAALIHNKLGWIKDETARAGIPITCQTLRNQASSNFDYLECAE